MKRLKHSIPLLVFLMISILTDAAHVTETDAKKVAVNFCHEHHMKTSHMSLVYTSGNTIPLFYVFGRKDGFVFVAADDRIQPILGYSNEGRPFLVPKKGDTTTLNNFWSLMETYNRVIQKVITQNLPGTTEISNNWERLKNNHTPKSPLVVVAPLLSTTWGQGWPYNSMCPIDPAGPGGHVWGGCVATAMSQIMRFWTAPTIGLGSFHYQSGSYPMTSANFNTTYNWANMPNSISTVNLDVSKIIYHTGVSVMSQWGPGNTSVTYSSDEDPITRSFCNYFKMASGIRYIKKVDWTDAQWNNLLQTDLIAGQPIDYRGDGNIAHNWVCDGVDATGLYHFNFGWDGNNNGYYSLGNINPGGNILTNNQCAIIGIKPVNDGSTLTTNTTWSTNMTITTNIWVPDSLTLTINAGVTIKFAPGCGLYVFGKLICNGTASNYVVLDASDTTNGWNGVRWDNNYMARLVMADNGLSQLFYTQIAHTHSSGVSCMAYGKVVLNHCKINNCYSTYGAGICVTWIPITVSYCEIFSNHATIQGGGISVASTDTLSSTINNNNFHNNVADASGGAFYFSSTNKTLAEGNTFSGNQAPKGAAGVLSNTTTTFKNSKLCNNTSTSQKGALYIENCNPTLVDLLIANNEGCGFYFDQSSSPVCLNLDIVNNHTPYYGGGGVIVNNSNPLFKNTILNGNVADISGNQIYLSTNNCDPYFDHCNVQGGVAGFGGPGSGSNYNTSHYTNNIDLANQFIAASSCAGTGCDGLNANWQLLSTSPDINAGDTLGVSTLLPATDLAGNPRITGNIIDIGAYEFLCTVPLQPSPITGNTAPCQGSTGNVYAVTNTTGYTYNWVYSGTNYTITGGQGTNSITVSYAVNATSGTWTVTPSNSCGSGPGRILAITLSLLPLQPSPITGNTTPCQGSTGNVYSVTNTLGVNYNWTYSGSNYSITSGQGSNSIIVTYAVNATSGSWTVTPSNSCGPGPGSTLAITMSLLPQVSGGMNGNPTPCQGSTQIYSIATIPNATGYTWTVPTTWTLVSGQGTNAITVTVGTANGFISVTPSNSCGPGASYAFIVTVLPLPGTTGPITGPASPCQGSSVVYTTTAVSNTTTYIWTVPSGWIISSGQNSLSITVTVGVTGGNVTVTANNSCGNSTYTSTFPVTVLPLPGTTGSITGPVAVCQNTSGLVYSIATVANATGYAWTVPSGWLISAGQNTTSITATAGSTGGNITVTANNSCGNSVNTSILPVSVNTPPTANAGVDQTINYGASTILNGSASGGSGGNYTYHWEPASLLLNANVQNPTTANLTTTVQFTLTVTDGNGCTGNDQMLVTVTGGPLSVNPTATPSTVCAGNVVQLMANAGGGTGNYTYTWTSNPSGFTSTVANPTVYPTITTTYMVIVNDGNATVSGNTLVTVNPLPGTPSQPNGQDSVDVKSVVSSVYTTSASPADSLVWDITTSAGVVTWTGITTVTVIWNPNFMGTATIKVKALNSCGESPWSLEKHVFVDNTTGIVSYNEPRSIVLFPNPNNGEFFIKSNETLSKIIVFDQLGRTIAEFRYDELQKYDCTKLPNGVYFVHIMGTKITTIKFIISH